MNRGEHLTFEMRSRGGYANWNAHHRVPPGRRKLPRLSANEDQAAQPRGGFERVRRARGERAIEPFDFTS